MGYNSVGKINLSKSIKVKLIQIIKQVDINSNLKLPTELELAKQLSVSRSTIRNALEELEGEGFIIRTHGRGTFVNPTAMQIIVNISPGEEFARIIRKSGYHARMEVVRFETVPSDKKLADILRIDVGEPVVIMEKIFYANNHPAIICIDRFPEKLVPRSSITNEEVETLSTFEILRNKAFKIIMRDKIEMEVLTLKEMEQFSSLAGKMECPAVLVFHGINYDQDNVPAIYDSEFYDTRFIRFNMIRQKNVYSDE